MCKISFLCRKFSILYKGFLIKTIENYHHTSACVRKSFCTILKWIRWRPWLSPIEISLSILNKVYYQFAHLMKMSKEGISVFVPFLLVLSHFVIHVYARYQSGNCFLIWQSPGLSLLLQQIAILKGNFS